MLGDPIYGAIGEVLLSEPAEQLELAGRVGARARAEDEEPLVLAFRERTSQSTSMMPTVGCTMRLWSSRRTATTPPCKPC